MSLRHGAYAKMNSTSPRMAPDTGIPVHCQATKRMTPMKYVPLLSASLLTLGVAAAAHAGTGDP